MLVQYYTGMSSKNINIKKNQKGSSLMLVIVDCDCAILVIHKQYLRYQSAFLSDLQLILIHLRIYS